jgi:branched-chain amino acid transport system substrate-binding protein
MALNLTRPQARRIFIIGLGAAAVSLAGCQTGRRPVRPGPIVEPPPLVIEQNMVAVIVPLTGSDGPVGTSISNAARLALLDTGEKSIKVTVYDSTVPGGAVAATQRAIAEGNRLILGPLLAEDVRAAAPVARRAGVPIIAFSNDEGVAGNGVYIMGFTPDQSISRVVSYARGKGSSRFAALVPTGLYGQRAAQAMIGAVRKSDGTVSVIQSYDRSKGAVAAAARRLNARGDVDAILIGDNGRIAAMAAPLLKVGPRRLGTELWATDKALGKTAALRGAWYAAAPDAQFWQA